MWRRGCCNESVSPGGSHRSPWPAWVAERPMYVIKPHAYSVHPSNYAIDDDTIRDRRTVEANRDLQFVAADFLFLQISNLTSANS